MKIIVGLGNPGSRYRDTRHNVGFGVLDTLSGQLGSPFGREKFRGLIAEARHGTERLLLLKPMTFMNRSGDSVAESARYFSVDPSGVLVVVDDVNLPLGRLRFRPGGSAGGHNGLKSIIERLGSDAFPRLRLGVGDREDERPLVGHVLGRFSPGEVPVVDEMVDRAVEGVLRFVEAGIGTAMNDYNGT